uniref:NXPE family member 3-like n=1 Tax=Ciona intestinalis TaxID=7719 RepID=F6UMV2_CIOIN|nr:NXPE family member 3-like [Ciona intestinalis]|eukprot:XP_009859615.1 NXPE family member 3-like [Ciona intestinalis]
MFGTKKWRLYYPELKLILESIESGKLKWPLPPVNTTSAYYSHLVVNKKQNYVVGDKLVMTIIAKDGNGKRKTHGGDYFFARLIHAESRNKPYQDGIACDIEDHGDGTYSVSAPLLIPGTSSLFIDLVHPSEAVVALVLEASGTSGSGIYFVATYPSSEEVVCNVSLSQSSPIKVCNFSQPTKGFSWFCDYPKKSSHCPKVLNYTKVSYKESDVFLLGKQSYFKQNSNWKIPIQGSGFSVDVLDSSFMIDYVKSLPECSVPVGMSQLAYDRNLGRHSGLYLNDKWQSLQCNNKITMYKQWTCLRNKALYLIGDSTMRQWYEQFETILNLNTSTKLLDHPEIWQKSRNGTNAEHNITVYYRSHGLPLHNPGPAESHPFIVDTLNNIPATSEPSTIIVINFALHFCLIDPKFYLYRVQAVKRSVISLMERSPGVKVFIRGCIRHRNTRKVVPTEWYSFRLCKILRAEFAEVPGVGFIDTWQMTTVRTNHINIHPDVEIVADQINLFLSYVC